MATVTSSKLAERAGGNAARYYECVVCGHRLRVTGLGRHRIYFEPDNVRLDDPVMDRACPACGHDLPGSNR